MELILNSSKQAVARYQKALVRYNGNAKRIEREKKELLRFVQGGKADLIKGGIDGETRDKMVSDIKFIENLLQEDAT